MLLDQQWHGYKRGHQLLASTTELPPRDQDLIDKLSDASGAPRPGERFAPYLSIYPLPSGMHHVVARTWQDLDAPRTGTVFTRSLLIPSELWRATRALSSIFDALADRTVTNQQAAVDLHESHWPPSHDPRLAELTEVLFLERAGAVAAFGYDASEVIAGRLLEALWPARRASMAVCTYALGPRSLGDRDFDLVFAPESARARFAKWGGRKLGGSKVATPARHAWTRQIVDRIFLDPQPGLQEFDEIGALSSRSRNDSSALRLALLWGDLKQSAPNTPKSLLGMLDILSSLDKDPWALSYFSPLVQQSLLAASRMPARDAWFFLLVLCKKLGSDMPADVARAIEVSAERLSMQEPGLFVEEVAEGNLQAVPRLVWRAVADGLSKAGDVELSYVLHSIGPAVTLPLMGESLDFACASTRNLALRPERHLVDSLANVAAADRTMTHRAALGIARGALTDDVAPLLRAAFASAPSEEFKALAEAVLANGGMSRAALLRILIDCFQSQPLEQQLREIAVSTAAQVDGDYILLELIQKRAEVEWLIRTLAHNETRLHALLAQMLTRWSDARLQDILTTGANEAALTAAAIANLPHSCPSLVRIIKLKPNRPDQTIALLRTVFPRMDGGDRAAIASAALNQIFSLPPDQTSDILPWVLANGEPSTIIRTAVAGSLTAAQVGKNVAAIAASQSMSRFAADVDIFTLRLTERHSGGYGSEGYEGWALLLRAARRVNPEALVLSADPALEYCLDRPAEPVSAVISAVFPIVHARLAKKSSLPEIPFNLLTAVYHVSVALFTEWDRSKSARHGLVDAFLQSSWQPYDLVRAAIDSGILPKILSDLQSSSDGRNYIERIRYELPRYPVEVANQFSDTLSRLLDGMAKKSDRG